MASIGVIRKAVAGSVSIGPVGGLARLRRRVREVEERNRWLEQRCQQIVKSADSVFLAFDEHGKIFDWNDQAERHLGWPRAEIIGRNVFEMLFTPSFDRERLAGVEPIHVNQS